MDKIALIKELEHWKAEYNKLAHYCKNGIECFANPCEKHSGERTPPFSEFFEKYGGQCLICVVDDNKALQAALTGEPVAYISHTSEGDIVGRERQFDAPSHTPLYADAPYVAELVEALEEIAASRDSGRHDGLPEEGPALSDVEAWLVARAALAAYRK